MRIGIKAQGFVQPILLIAASNEATNCLAAFSVSFSSVNSDERSCWILASSQWGSLRWGYFPANAMYTQSRTEL
jgi:hypothetical protein